MKLALIAMGLDVLLALLDRIAQPGSSQTIHGSKLTLEDAFRSFQENKSGCAQAASGAIVRRTDRDSVQVFLLFLDRARNPLVTGTSAGPVGHYLVRELDPELAAAFGSNDVVIID